MHLTQHCYAITGLFCNPPWMVNSGFVIGRETTLVIDAGANSQSAATIYGYAHNVKPANMLILINTEQHFDHIGGNSFFSRNNVEIMGHENINRTSEELIAEINYFNQIIDEKMRKDLNEGSIAFSNTNIKNPDKRINKDITIELGELKAEVLLTPGHTPSNLSIYIPEDLVLYTGDCIVNNYHPNLLAGSKPDWETWLNSLERISKLELNYIVPGHGDVIAGEDIPRQIERIKKILINAMKSI